MPTGLPVVTRWRLNTSTTTGAELTSPACIQRERCIGEQTSLKTTSCISSLYADAARLLDASQLPWVMDVTFGEDRSHIRNGESVENTGVLCSIAPHLLKHHPSKSSLRQKHLRASINNDFLLHLITQL